MKVVNINDHIEKPVTSTEKLLARAINYSMREVPDYVEAGDIYRVMREKLNLTTVYISKRLGVTKERLEAFECGQPDPDPELLGRAYVILLALETTQKFLLPV